MGVCWSLCASVKGFAACKCLLSFLTDHTVTWTKLASVWKVRDIKKKEFSAVEVPKTFFSSLG